MTGESSRMMIDLKVNYSWPSWLRSRVLFPQKGDRGYNVSGIITLEWRRLFISLGHVKILIRARYFGGPQDHWIWMFWWSDIISGGLGPPDHCQLWTLVNKEKKAYFYFGQFPTVGQTLLFILAVKLTRIAWFSAISPSILNRFSSNFAKVIFYSNHNGPENFAKLYSVFQKLDHLTCNELKLRRSSLTPLN